MKACARFIPAASLLAALVAVSTAPAGVTNYTTPVGFVNLPIAGTGGTNANYSTFIGLPLTRGAIEGTMETFNGAVITDSNATWAINQFAGTNGAHYIEICSGPEPGTMEEIVSNTSNTVTLASDLSGILTNGTSFRIRQHWTLGSIFGVSNSFGLKSGSSFSSSDEVLIYDPVKPGYDGYFYRSNATVRGWRSATNGIIDAAGTIVYPEQGIVLRRKVADGTNILLVGEIKTGPTIIPVSVGANFIGNIYAVTNFTLATSGLFTTNETTGLKSGGSLASADEVLLWTGNGYSGYFFRSNATQFGWRSATNGNLDASNTVIPLGSSVVIKRKGASGFDWTVPGHPH